MNSTDAERRSAAGHADRTVTCLPVAVRNVAIGAGRPKICIPLTGRSEEEILAEASAPEVSLADLVEWRVDHYDRIEDPGAAGCNDRAAEQRTAEMIAGVLHVLRQLREILGDRPLLFTFRTQAEGGMAPITAEAYEQLLTCASESGLVDLVDLELSAGEDRCRRLLDKLHAAGVPVVMSNHDFEGTPEGDEILRRLRQMQALGADILKIAVMPRSDADVLTLLSATLQMRDSGTRQPLITMAMAERGVISRVAGGFYGSAVTFGAAGRASAPGQMEVGKLREVLELLYPENS